MAETGEKANPCTSGDKLYQERARRALPLLVRQAESKATLPYSALAAELAMPNARNLNFVLGSVGETLEELSEKWKARIPPIQCLIVNKETGLPGNGIGWFLVKKENFSKLPLAQKQAIVKAELSHVFAYPHWRRVLNALGLQPVAHQYETLLAQAAAFRGSGESVAHKQLKEYVASHPEVLKLPGSFPKGTTEYVLPSGDSLDVSFEDKASWIAAEVKSASSPVADIVRGIYQCVKYRAVMEAVLSAQSSIREVRAVLVLEDGLPDLLIALRNTLGVEVVEHITPAGG